MFRSTKLGFLVPKRGRKKQAATRAEARVPRPKDVETWAMKPIVFTMRGTPGFRDWLGRLAEHDRMSVAGLVERAVVFYAKHVGFTEPPPER